MRSIGFAARLVLAIATATGVVLAGSGPAVATSAPVPSATPAAQPSATDGLDSVLELSAGSEFSLALRFDGTVYAWGYNRYGQLGHGDGLGLIKRLPIPVLGLDDIVGISAGYTHSLAVRSDGTVWSWGANEHGQLGDGTLVSRSTAVQVVGLTSIVAASAGTYHNLALDRDGTV